MYPFQETIPTQKIEETPRRRSVARVLLADTRLATRLALAKILSTAGYAVNGAATEAEAVSKLDQREYQLVLADLRSESDEAGHRLLAYAKQKEFRPATALILSEISETDWPEAAGGADNRAVHISNENVYDLLRHVADLISQRADRRIRKAVLAGSQAS